MPRTEKALDSNTLADKRMRSIYKENLAEIKEQMNACKEQIDNLLNKFESDLQKSGISDEVRSSFISGSRKGMQAIRDYWHESFELESQSLKAMLNIYLFLDNHDGEFSLVNDQLLFNDAAVLKNYNDLVNTLEEISMRQERLNKEFQDRAQSKLKEFESLL